MVFIHSRNTFLIKLYIHISSSDIIVETNTSEMKSFMPGLAEIEQVETKAKRGTNIIIEGISDFIYTFLFDCIITTLMNYLKKIISGSNSKEQTNFQWSPTD